MQLSILFQQDTFFIEVKGCKMILKIFSSLGVIWDLTSPAFFVWEQVKRNLERT